MQLHDAVIKRSHGRLQLHALKSDYCVDINDYTLTLIATALEDPNLSGPGRRLVDRLSAHGLVREGQTQLIPRREESNLISIEIEPTGRCNLACRHCYVTFSHVTMTDAIFDAVLTGARALGAVEMIFNGGEPLLHPRCLAWLEIAARAGLRPLLFTNATLVTDAIAQRLATAGVAKVTVSLDGFEAAHDAMRGAGAFESAVRGIRSMVAAGLAVHTTAVAHPGNEHELPALLRFCREALGARGTRVSAVMALGRAKDQPSLQLAADALRTLYDGNERQPASDLQHTLQHTPGLLLCRAGANKLYVSARGTVHGCHLFDGVGAPLGVLPGSPLEEIYRDAPASNATPVLFNFSPSHLHACADCPHLSTCRGGCRARAWQMTGDPLGPDPVACRKRGIAPNAA